MTGIGWGDSGEGAVLFRVTADGQVDTEWGDGGVVHPDLGGTASSYGLGVTADGHVLQVFETAALGADYDVGLARYRPDGTLDATFGDGGVAVVPTPGTQYANNVVELPDGRIVVTGYDDGDVLLLRFEGDGTLDATFGDGGRMSIDLGGDDAAWAITVQPDGTILFAIDSYATDAGGADRGLLMRVLADGTLDPGFGTGGVLDLPFGMSMSYDIVVQPDGRILVSSGTNDSPHKLTVARFEADGTLDTTFGDGGSVSLGRYYYGSDRTGLELQPDGSIVVSGAAWSGPSSTDDREVRVTRLTNDGEIDPTFGEGELGDTAWYTEGGAAIVLDGDVAISDPELGRSNDGAGDWSGATLTIERAGGANGDDAFSFAPNAAFSVGGDEIGTDAGTFAVFGQSAGTLTIAFGGGDETPTTALAEALMRSIAYSNAFPDPDVVVDLDWTLRDGNEGAQGAGGSLTATGTSRVIVNDVREDDADLHAWSRIETLFDAEGARAGRSIDYDDGRSATYSYEGGVRRSLRLSDEDDAFTWASIDKRYDDTGALERSAVAYDDGRIIAKTYADGSLASRMVHVADLDGTRPWDTRETTFDADGEMVGRAIGYDDGRLVTRGYEDGVLRTSRSEDAADVHAWTSISKRYDASGVVERSVVAYDDGRLATVSFDDGLRTGVEWSEWDIG